MYQPKVITPVLATVPVAGGALLPVTGNDVGSMVLIGIGSVVVGLLLIRSARLRRDES